MNPAEVFLEKGILGAIIVVLAAVCSTLFWLVMRTRKEHITATKRYADELAAATAVHTERLEHVREECDAKIASVRAEADARVAALEARLATAQEARVQDFARTAQQLMALREDSNGVVHEVAEVIDRVSYRIETLEHRLSTKE